MTAADQFFQSFRLAFKNPGYLALLALQFAVMLVLQTLAVIMNLRMLGLGGWTIDEATASQLFTAQNLLILIPAIIIEGALFLACYFYFQAAIYGMAHQLAIKGKVRFNAFHPLARQYWRPIVANQIIAFLAIILVAIVGFIILLPFLVFSFKGENIATAGYLLLPVAVLLAIAIIIIVLILLVFTSAGIFFSKMSGWESFKNGIRAGLRQPTTALKVIVGYLWAGIVFLILWTILYVPYFAIFWQSLLAQTSTPAMAITGKIIDNIASLLSALIFGIVTIFLFSMYKQNITISKEQTMKKTKK